MIGSLPGTVPFRDFARAFEIFDAGPNQLPHLSGCMAPSHLSFYSSTPSGRLASHLFPTPYFASATPDAALVEGQAVLSKTLRIDGALPPLANERATSILRFGQHNGEDVLVSARDDSSIQILRIPMPQEMPEVLAPLVTPGSRTLPEARAKPAPESREEKAARGAREEEARIKKEAEVESFVEAETVREWKEERMGKGGKEKETFIGLEIADM